MKRVILPIALCVLVAAGGCARWRKTPGEVVLPSGARMPPATASAAAPAPAPDAAAVSTAPAPSAVVPPPPAAEPKRRWWQRKPKTAPAPSAAPAVTAVTPPPAAPNAAPAASQPKSSWWGRQPKESPVSATATQKPVRVYRMKVGDPIVIALRGIPGYPGGQQNIEGVLDENGCINLPFLNVVQASGKTPSELEREIRDRYINEGYYRDLGVNIIIPSQSYFVRGEVRGAGRFQLMGGTTILQAIASAGGYTEFANPRRVELLRGEQRFVVNMREIEKYPARDKELESGDVIIVPRSAF
ncbi:MAG TPA: polysaccharide biosynthesis/export family protein [Kiritimatiellia bacterium]|nr:polysaccharide biosynthesis/export family protein [Kiritimatiellia bacterium]HSA18907.1 polysaccharide biosynthesis/export family protein [Kiritimatiellia bacterium]